MNLALPPACHTTLYPSLAVTKQLAMSLPRREAEGVTEPCSEIKKRTLLTPPHSVCLSVTFMTI